MNIKERIEQLYKERLGKILPVYDTFIDFFGEPYVDLQPTTTFENVYTCILPLNPVKTELLSLKDISHIKGLKVTNFTIKDIDNYPELYEKINEARFKYLVTQFSDVTSYILVWFPEVTVTNEHGNSTFVEDLYAKIRIENDGTISSGFRLNRATYSIPHLKYSYMHSHIECIPLEDLSSFQYPCLGEGPIRNTIASLSKECDFDMWKLFCLELSKYVTVESLTGVPYRKLENIGAEGSTREVPSYCDFSPSIDPFTENSCILFENFIEFLLKEEVINFGFAEGAFVPGMAPIDYLFKISNAFVDWYNTQYNMGYVEDSLHDLLCNKIIRKAIISDAGLYVYKYNQNSSSGDYEEYIGDKICTFKGKDILFTISDRDMSKDAEQNIIYLLDVKVANYILYKLLIVLNYNYGNNKTTGNQIIEDVIFI